MTRPAPTSDSPARCLSLGGVGATILRIGGRAPRWYASLPRPRRPAPPLTTPCPLSTPRTRPGFVPPGGVVVAPRAATSLPGPPWPTRRSLRTPMPPPVSLGGHPPTTASHAGFHPLCQSFGRADQRRHAALPQACPGVLDTIAITDQETRPVANELRQRGVGTMRVSLTVGHLRMRHAPQINGALTI
jgi:hypothetical protein